jgi:hypothetical protein
VAATGAAARAAFNWRTISDAELLELRLADLPLRIEGTPLAARLETLAGELAARSLRFRPHVWLSEEWFTPDGVPGFAIPFYLAHPRLMRLERRQMLEVEGCTARECLQIMRHEAGHAISNAFNLHRRRAWREHFGQFTQPYPHVYRPKPNSRDYVLHLNAWYAQAHPAEDFAETFAVWLRPRARWRRSYENWPALRKLEYVDKLMTEIADRVPPSRSPRQEVEPLAGIKTTLGEHYARKRAYYAVKWPAYYDLDLQRIFSADEGHNKRRAPRQPAAQFLRRVRRQLRDEVAEGTGVHHYTIDYLLKNMIDRCRTLKLRVTTDEKRALRQAIIMLTVQTMNVLHAGYHPIAL